MKDGPISTFNQTIRNVLVNSINETCAAFGFSVTHEPQLIRKSISMNGDYLAGIRVSGANFQGAVTLSMDKRIAKSFADKIFAGTNAKSDDAMLCDLVGEVCNQITGVFQRTLAPLGCRLQVTAQETAQSPNTFEVAPNPEEWLLTPFVYADGRGVLAFGFVGELGLGSDDTAENLRDARNITFF